MPGAVNPSVLLAGIGVAVTGLLGYNVVHKPQQQKLALIQEQILQAQSKQQAAGGIAEVAQRIEQYRARLPKEPDPSWLVRTVASLAEQSGVQLTSISQESPQQLDQFTRLGVKLQVASTYHQLGAFLDRIERDPQFILVEAVDFAEPQGPVDNRLSSVTLVLSTFYMPPPMSTVSAGAAP